MYRLIDEIFTIYGKSNLSIFFQYNLTNFGKEIKKVKLATNGNFLYVQLRSH